MKPKKNPKPFVVYMWTVWDARAKFNYHWSATERREAEATRKDDIKRGYSVGPITRVELPRPVKAEKP